MSPDVRLVTVLVTVAVPDTADATHAATLVALAATTTALDVVHTTAVEGHVPLPGSTVLRGRQARPWLVQAVNDRTAIVTDLAGGVVEVSLRSLSHDPLMAGEPGVPAGEDRAR